MNTSIALQLYSLRNESFDNIRSLFEWVKVTGFQGVELAGYYDQSPVTIRRLLEDQGLEIIGNHISIPTPAECEAVTDAQEEGGVRRVMISHPPEAFPTLQDVQRAADRLNELAQIFKARKLQLYVHNHWWEFRQKHEGMSVFEHLCALTTDDVFFELDMYWAMTGGVDPASVANTVGERVKLLHVKDGPCLEDLPMTALGTGTMDLPRVLRSFPWVTWQIIELDSCAADMKAAIQESFIYLKNIASTAQGRKV